MTWFDRLFDRPHRGGEAAPDARLREAIEHAVQVVDPRLTLLPHHEAMLAPAIGAASGHLHAVLDRLGPVHEGSAAGWSADPLVRALFPLPADVPAVLSRSAEVQNFFQREPGANEAFGALICVISERRVLESAVQSGVLQPDATRTVISFDDPRLGVVAATPQMLRRGVGQRMFNQLLMIAAERVHEQEHQLEELKAEQSLLRARLRMLHAREATLTTVCDESALEQIPQIEARLASAGAGLSALGGDAGTLEKRLRLLVDTLAQADQAIRIAQRRLRLDPCNRVVDPLTGEDGADIEFAELRLEAHPPCTRALVLMHLGRRGLQPGGLAIEEVGRTL